MTFPLFHFLKKNLANSELIKFFSKCKDGKVRSVKISIENGELLIEGLDREVNRFHSTVSLLSEGGCYFYG